MKNLLLIMLCTLCWCGAVAEENKSMIIDVRTLEEWKAGHLASAQHIELQNIAASIEQLVPDKDQQLYLYCRSGNRSGQAKAIIEQMGYANVVNAGGIGDASIVLVEAIVE